MEALIAYGIYIFPLALIFALFARKRSDLERTSAAVHNEAVEAGMTQPPSLHPVIDHAKCIGCESCVHACPEFPAHQVLGIVEGKADLVSPTDCIGHGACKTVCPVDAISLVFGTAERGIELPNVNADFSTNVPGVYIAGELGGMGLIRNAIEQGRQAMEGIVATQKTLPAGDDDCLDVLIVGAGPAGFSATLGAMEAGLKHATIDQNSVGGTVAKFPRGKLVMTAPAYLPMIGEVRFTETLKEELVGFWQEKKAETGMKISGGEQLLSIERLSDDRLRATTDKASYDTKAVLLAIGRRGTPRQLGVPGEDQPKVVYSLIDPAEYAHKAVVVVGGGDSALEAACSIAEEVGSSVTLSYRSNAFSRAKKKNRDRVERLCAAGKLQVFLESTVQNIEPESIVLVHKSEVVELANDAVIVCAGGVLPTTLLEDVGIRMETKYGTS